MTKSSSTMKVAQVTEFGKPPKVVEVDSPIVLGDAPESDLVDLKLTATGIHRLVQARAAGNHYSAKGLPHIPGVDGVFKTADGKLVFVSFISPTGGTMAEELKAPKASIVPVPDGCDPIQVAGLVNPIMSGWMALATRVRDLPKNFTVLIVGATSLSGTCAITVSREFGAGKVIGCARNLEKMANLGLDDTIKLEDDVNKTDFSKLGQVDVILDYLYGPIIPHLFSSLSRPARTVQYIQIGSVAGLSTELPADQLRSKNIAMTGSGPGSWSVQQYFQQLPGMVGIVSKIRPYKFETVHLPEIENAWTKGGERIVVVP